MQAGSPDFYFTKSRILSSEVKDFGKKGQNKYKGKFKYLKKYFGIIQHELFCDSKTLIRILLSYQSNISKQTLIS